MILDDIDLSEMAADMRSPHIIADTREGSGKARFILVDAGDTLWMPEGSPEITRATFNQLRKTGVLDAGPDNALKLDIYRAWQVKGEQHGDQGRTV